MRLFWCLVLCMVLFLAGVRAVDDTTILDKTIAYYEFESAGRRQNSSYAISGYSTGLVLERSADAVFESAGCKLGECYNFTGSADYIRFNWTMENYTELDLEHSVAFWMRGQGGSSGDAVFGFYSDTYAEYYSMTVDTGDVLMVYTGDDANEQVKSVTDVIDLAWHFIVFNYHPGGKRELYVDGVLEGNKSSADDVVEGDTDYWYIGCRGRNGGASCDSDSNITIDDMLILNETLNGSMVTYLYNGSSGRKLSEPEQINITITWDVPVADESFSSVSLDFNWTVQYVGFGTSPPDDTVTCDIYCNGALNHTVAGINSNVSNTYIMSYGSDTQANFNYSILCNGTLGSGATENRSIYVDTVNPSIVHNFVENKTYYWNTSSESVVAQFNFSDEYLFAYNVSVDTQFITGGTNMGGSNYQYNFTYNVENLTSGLHYVNITVWDGHTTKSIPEWDYDKSDKTKGITFNFNNRNGYVKVLPLNAEGYASDFDTVKVKDRYLFTYSRGVDERLAFGNDLGFVVSSSHKIFINVKDDYEGWLVIPGLDKWVDFENDGRFSGVDVVRLDDYNVRVVVSGLLDDVVTFSSVGSLNSVNGLYPFYSGNHSTIIPTGLVGEEVTIWLNVSNFAGRKVVASLTYNGSVVDDVELEVNSSSVLFNGSLTPAGGGVVNFTWLVNVSDVDGLYQFTVNGSQVITGFGIDDCSEYTDNTLNINIYDEDNPTTPLVATVDIDGVFWPTNPSNSVNFTTRLSGGSNYTLCIGEGSLFANFIFNYNSTNGFTHRYYIFNQSFNSSVQNISMYNFDTTTGISDLRMTLRNVTNYGYYPDIVARLQRRYLSEGVWRTVQMDRSGDFGLTFFNIREETTDYRFIFTDEANNVLDTTTRIKFACDSAVCELTMLLSPYQELSVTSEIRSSYIYDNVSSLINVSWNNTLGDNVNVRLRVSKDTSAGTNMICDSSQSGSAGLISCDVSGFSGSVFVLFTSEGDLVVGEFADLPRARLYDLIGVREGSFYSTLVIITAAGFGAAISPVMAVLSAIFGIIAVFWIGIFNPITLSFIIIICVLGGIIGVKIRK